MGGRTAAAWQTLSDRVRAGLWSTPRKRLATRIILVIIVQAVVLCVTYRAVVIHDRTLLTGSYITGTEGSAPPYGYNGPPLSGWNEIDAGASAWQMVPQIKKAHLELASGELPLWDSNVMLGAPLAADAVHGMFNPLTWPLVADPSPGVWDAWLLARLLLAGLLCTALVRYLGLGTVPATLAGLIYMMSGVFQVRTTTIQTGVMAMLPLVILGMEMCIRRPTRWAAALVAVAIASTVLFGMPEESFIVLLFSAIYFAVRFLAQWRQHGRPGVRVIATAAGGGVLGFLLGLPLVLPFLEFVRVSYTAHNAGTSAALQIQDGRQLMSLVGPHWNAVGPRIFTDQYAPFDNWFGVGAIILAALGLFSRDLPRGVRSLLVVTAVTVEAKNVGFPDWYNQAFPHIPGLGQTSFWAYSGILVSLAVALFAGAGLQRVIQSRLRLRHVLLSAAAVAAIVVAATPQYLAGTIVRWDQVAITVTAFVAVLAGLVLAVHRAGRRVGIAVVALAVTVELIVLATPEYALPVRYDPLTATPTSQYLQTVMPSGSGRSYSPNGVLYPTTNQAFNIDDVRNLDPILIDRSWTYLKDFVVPHLTDRFDGLGPNSAVFSDNPFFDAMNVEYLLVAPKPAVDPSLVSADQYKLATVAADNVAIYRNTHAAPRAQLFFSARPASSAADADALMKRPGFDPTKNVVVEAGGSALPNDTARGPEAARVVSYTDDRAVISTDASEASVLVIADAFYAGWEAQVDGVPTPIHAANLAMRGVGVPSGSHTITLSYRPASFQVGVLGPPLAVVLFALGGWGLPVAARVRRRVRRMSG